MGFIAVGGIAACVVLGAVAKKPATRYLCFGMAFFIFGLSEFGIPS